MGKYNICFDFGTAHIGCVLFKDGVVDMSFQYSYKDVIADLKNCVTTCGERRQKRSTRRKYDHSRRRRNRLLMLLNENGFLDKRKDELKATLSNWRNNKIAPEDIIESFTKLNPYADRAKLISETLDMTSQKNKLCFVRAMYSIINHRGFAEEHGIQMIEEYDELEQDSETGIIRKSINKLSEQMAAEGMRTVGEFMNKHLTDGETIRHTYQYSRKQIRDEFNMICDVQHISKRLRTDLFHVIFDEHVSHRKPVRKKCPFIKKNAFVTYTSHPAFEEFRMWQFIRNIYIIDENDGRRSLTDAEVNAVLKLYMRRSDDFDFKDIRNALKAEQCNYSDDTNVKACAFTVSLSKTLGLKDAFGLKEHLSSLLEMDADDALNEVWNVCFEAKRSGKHIEYFSHKLHCDDFEISKIKLAVTTASISAKACRMITEWMRDKHLKMPFAVRMVNMRNFITSHIDGYEADEMTNAKIEKVVNALHNYNYEANGTLNEYILDVLKTMALDRKPTLNELNETLWNHSVINQYQLDTDDKGNRLLPVMQEYFTNPQIDKAASFIRRLINMLIKKGFIDPDDTSIIIESGRCDHSIVGRKAISIINAENKKLRDEAIAFAKRCKIDNPSDEQIERYILWNEQNGLSIWTGKSIKKKDIFSQDYQVDHTEPRTYKGPNLLFNKTLCETTANQAKLNTMPGNMPDIENVRKRVEELYKPLIDELESRIKRLKKKINTSNVESVKNEYRVKRIIAEDKLDYYKNKIATFDAVTPRDGFSNAHVCINDVITRCMRNWLKCMFRDVTFIRASDVADARSKWHLNKNREDNCNHVQDAFVLGCLKIYGVPEEGVLPYERFSEDLKVVNNSLTYNASRKSPSVLMKKASGAGYGRSMSKETKYGLITIDGKEHVVVKKPVNKELDVENIVDGGIKRLFDNVKKEDYDKVISYNRKPLRSVRVFVKSLRPDTTLKIKRKNSLSEKEKNNFIYYSPEGCACMGYYEDNKTHKLSVEEEMRGMKLPETHPQTESKLKYVIRLDDTVILMRNDETEENIRNMSREELSKRIFIVNSMGYSDKRNIFVRHDCSSMKNVNKESNIDMLGREDVRCFRLTNVKLIKDNEIVMKLLFKKKNAI